MCNLSIQWPMKLAQYNECHQMPEESENIKRHGMWHVSGKKEKATAKWHRRRRNSIYAKETRNGEESVENEATKKQIREKRGVRNDEKLK